MVALPTRSLLPRRPSEDGYNLVVLAVAITVLNIMIAMALPMWSHLIQREKEEELIFRGLQYAEAIRLFLLRQKHYPVKLEDLIETEPRCVRQLWTNPMTEDGSWRLIPVSGSQVPGQPRGRRGAQPGGDQGRDLGGGGVDPNDQAGRARERLGSIARESGGRGPKPFLGVASSEGGEAIKTFLGSTDYGEWEFRVELVSNLKIPPDRFPGSMSSAGFWKPFPPGVNPPQGGGFGQPPGQDPGRPDGQRPGGGPGSPVPPNKG